MMQKHILVVDDDESVLASIALVLKQAGYAYSMAASPAETLRRLQHGPCHLVLQDMNFSRDTSGAEGLALLETIKKHYPALPVVLMTAWASIPLAVQGLKAGAADFVSKPWTNENLLHCIATTLGVQEARNAEGRRVPDRAELDARYDFSMVVGANLHILRVLELVGRIAPTDASVLISGESGTGKEVLAEAVHRNSLRASGPFVKVNLGGISTTLFESEMFGHVKGAFTDAHTDRKGRFALADGGTIFLDEIGELEAACQVKLLRVLQDRSFEALGSSLSRTVDVRVISATNRKLGELVESGKFREDLLYRLNLIVLHLPPLRERSDDIPLLARHFGRSIAALYRRPGLDFDTGAIQWLMAQSWPGNIRQLKQIIERTALMTDSITLGRVHFERTLGMYSGGETAGSPPLMGEMTLEEMEEAMVRKAMEQHGGNISRVAEALGISRAALYRRLEKFGIRV